MNTNAIRTWYRLHWGTMLTVFFVGVTWAGHAFPSTIGIIFPTSSWYSEGGRWDYIEGWPMICIQSDDDVVLTDALGLAVDCVLAVASLAAVGFVAESLERGRMRFRISTMLTVVAALAVLCAFWRWDARQPRDIARIQSLDVSYIPLEFAGWYTDVPVLFALGCLAYSVLRFAQAAGVQSFAFLRRSAYRSPVAEAAG